MSRYDDPIFARAIERAWTIYKAKGEDYVAGAGSRTANFYRRAEQAGITPLQAWSVYAGKHWDAISTFCQRGQVESEPIEDRISDMINYCVLLSGMVPK